LHFASHNSSECAIKWREICRRHFIGFAGAFLLIFLRLKIVRIDGLFLFLELNDWANIAAFRFGVGKSFSAWPKPMKKRYFGLLFWQGNK
tara:strand:+ start:56 stop:325 length:270 start_codon:yes stop_codon:yes gene_type:complete